MSPNKASPRKRRIQEVSTDESLKENIQPKLDSISDSISEAFGIDGTDEKQVFQELLQFAKLPANDQKFSFLLSVAKKTFKPNFYHRRALAFEAIRSQRPEVLELLEVIPKTALGDQCLAMALLQNKTNIISYFDVTLPANSTNPLHDFNERYPEEKETISFLIEVQQSFLNIFGKLTIGQFDDYLNQVDINFPHPVYGTLLEYLTAHTLPPKNMPDIYHRLFVAGADLYSNQAGFVPFDRQIISAFSTLVKAPLLAKKDLAFIVNYILVGGKELVEVMKSYDINADFKAWQKKNILYFEFQYGDDADISKYRHVKVVDRTHSSTLERNQRKTPHKQDTTSVLKTSSTQVDILLAFLDASQSTPSAKSILLEFGQADKSNETITRWRIYAGRSTSP